MTRVDKQIRFEPDAVNATLEAPQDQLIPLLPTLQFRRVWVIGARETLAKPNNWDNEIHPKWNGFKLIAEE